MYSTGHCQLKFSNFGKIMANEIFLFIFRKPSITSHMQKVYRNTAIFIILILIGVQWGFYQTYTSQFPNFINKTPTIHVHGIFLMMWMVLLIIQPLLINTGRTQLHRTIGKISWVLGPLIIGSMFMVGRGSYGRSIGVFPEQEIDFGISLSTTIEFPLRRTLVRSIIPFSN